MEKIVQARPYILTFFFIGLFVFAMGNFNDAKNLSWAGGALAHTALFLFILTESFGSVSKQRHPLSRNFSRLVLVLSGFVVTGIITSLFRVAFSS